ncbi:hypothetical protein HanIR_Chr15g0748031 [Helianthus annuus]|nr:hypothetical protein HanIR_Chr15g0748031 [Helianthus annuus]
MVDLKLWLLGIFWELRPTYLIPKITLFASSHLRSPPPPLRAPHSEASTFSAQAQGMPQQQAFPFGAQPWQVQSRPLQSANVKSQTAVSLIRRSKAGLKHLKMAWNRL